MSFFVDKLDCKCSNHHLLLLALWCICLRKFILSVNCFWGLFICECSYFGYVFCYIFRTIANYIVWSIMQNRVNNLPRRFLEARDDYVMVLYLSHKACRFVFVLPRHNHSYHISLNT